MNLPSRGLRPSATTMRNAGLFFAPTRFNRILTAINQRSLLGRPHPDHPPFKGFPEKSVEPRRGSATWQALFLRFLRFIFHAVEPAVQDPGKRSLPNAAVNALLTARPMPR